MNVSKAVSNGLRRFVIGAVALAVFAIIATLIPRPFFPAAAAAGGGGVKIFVVSNPIHSDIIIPFDDAVRKDFAFLKEGNGAKWFDNPNVRFLSIGWGGREFYLETPTWDKLKAFPLLKGLTIDNAVMHVEPLGDIFRDNPTVLPLSVTGEAMASLQSEIHASFTKNADQKPILISGRSYGQFDDFYEATGYFNALLGCNTWTARMLRVAGLRTGLWNPLPQSLRLSLKLYN